MKVFLDINLVRSIGIKPAYLYTFLFNNFEIGEEFCYTIYNMATDVGISSNEIKSSLKLLKDLGYISIIKKGLPAQNFYTILKNV